MNMENALITVNALINATAVWFILKAVEVIPFSVYDVVASIRRTLRTRKAPDTVQEESCKQSYDRTRGKLEYVFSGDGFFHIALFRKSKTRLSISTIVPLVVFALELMSIILSNNTTTCETSRDMSIVSAPSLILFGEGERHTNFEKLFVDQEASGSALRECVTWLSLHSGVEYLCSMCGETSSTFIHILMMRNSNDSIGVVMPKMYTSTYVYHIYVQRMASKPTLKAISIFGVHSITSEVLVNGRGVVHRNITNSGAISQAMLTEIRRFVHRYEIVAEINQSRYFEDEEQFEFVWDRHEDYAIGLRAVIYALLAQSTREAIKPARNMSNLNLTVAPNFLFDISCREDSVLPRRASLVIIIIGVICRLLFSFIPRSMSSVEFALMTSEKQDKSRSRGIFSMRRYPTNNPDSEIDGSGVSVDDVI